MRITPDEATVEAAGDPDLLTSLAVQPKGERPFRGAREMGIRVAGLDPVLELPVDATQRRIAEGTYSIRSSEEPALTAQQSVPDRGWDAFFASDALIQTRHPDIRGQAREIVGEAVDPWEKALALYQWVYTHIEKRSVLSVPSALDVLKTRQGDCNEHTVLFTALARAAGIPTRIALGVVWSEELDGFYYHAWPEVYMGEWIWMDPTLGQPVADATHVKLVNGDIAQWARIMPFLGRLQLEITDIR
jgi:transglutaminase-like putative cysteine protease